MLAALRRSGRDSCSFKGTEGKEGKDVSAATRRFEADDDGRGP